MTQKKPRPATSVSPMACAPAAPAPSIASGSSASKAAPRSAPVAKLTKCGSSRAARASGTQRNTPANAALAMPPTAANSTIHKSSGIPSLQPAGCAHPPAPPGPAVREKTSRVGVRTPAAAEHRGASDGAEAAPGERAEISLPAAARVGAERLGRPGVVPQEGRAHLLAHFEVSGPDRGPQPRDELGGRQAEPHHGGFQHSGGEPAPAGVHRADGGAVARGEEYRHAIRGLPD